MSRGAVNQTFAPRQESVVARAEQLQVAGSLGAAAHKRHNVMKLQERAFAATVPVGADVGASCAVASEHLATYFVINVRSVRRCSRPLRVIR